MSMNLISVGLVAVFLSVIAGYSQGCQNIQGTVENGAKLIDTIDDKEFGACDTLVTDRDDNIYRILFTRKEGHLAERSRRWLGQAEYESGDLTIANQIREGEVAFIERRKTVESGAVYHAVATWSLSRSGRPGAVFSYYVFFTRRDKVDLLLREEGDLFAGDFLIADVLKDGNCYLVVSGRGETGDSGWMKLWRLGPNGALNKIGFDPPKGYNPRLLDDGIETSETEVTTRGTVERFYTYTWDRAKNVWALRGKREYISRLVKSE
jgi:hypothetical protein